MIAYLTSRVRDVPDFPKDGIVFKDITPLLADPKALAGAVDTLAERVTPTRPDIVLGAESRGFILGPALATRDVDRGSVRDRGARLVSLDRPDPP